MKMKKHIHKYSADYGGYEYCISCGLRNPNDGMSIKYKQNKIYHMLCIYPSHDYVIESFMASSDKEAVAICKKKHHKSTIFEIKRFIET